LIFKKKIYNASNKFIIMLGTSTKWFLALFIYLPLIIVILGFLYYLIFYYQKKIKRIIQTTKKNAQEKISNAQIIAH
ncbi:MAG: hypothetical protein Q8736_02510, partial [Sweet potato little leaf phytoplasma]|nr:hypothetical protein [Sweet potato little leaf phytoplasma]